MDRYDVKNGRFNATRNGGNASERSVWTMPDEERMPKNEATRHNPVNRDNREAYHVAPLEPTLRPEHAVLGGPAFLRGVPAALDNADINVAEPYYQRASENVQGFVTTARLLLARATRASQMLYTNNLILHTDEQERQNAVRVARAEFSQVAYDLQQLMKQATAEPVARLRGWERALFAAQLDMTRAMAQPGVPAVAIRRYLQQTESAIGLTLPKHRSPESPDDNPNNGAGLEKTKNPIQIDWGVAGRFACYLPGGVLIGLCLGERLRWLDKELMKDWDPMSLGWMAFFGAVGIGAIHLFGMGVSKLWELAGGKAEEEPKEVAAKTRLINWRTVRHAVLPLTATGVICAVEASIIRNVIVNSLTVQDPNNIAYFLGALPVILPAAIASGAYGWQRGRNQARETERAQEERGNLPAGHARREAIQTVETLVQSPEAQTAVALAYLIDTVREKIAGVKEEIAKLLEPYEALLAEYREGIKAVMPDPEARKLVAQLYEDAVACYEDFLREHRVVVRLTDGEPIGRPTIINHFWTKGDAAPPVEKKPTRWQCFTAFVGRIFRRNKGR